MTREDKLDFDKKLHTQYNALCDTINEAVEELLEENSNVIAFTKEMTANANFWTRHSVVSIVRDERISGEVGIKCDNGSVHSWSILPMGSQISIVRIALGTLECPDHIKEQLKREGAE